MHHIRLGTPDPLQGGLSLLQFAPDWSGAASCGARGESQRVITVWDNGSEWRRDAVPVLSLHGHQHPVVALAYLPGLGRLASAAKFEPTVRIWDLNSGILCDTIPDCGSPVVLLAATQVPALALAVGAMDGRISLYDAASMQLMSSLDAHERPPPLSLLFGGAGSMPHPEDRYDMMLFSADDSATYMWDVASGKQLGSQPSGAQQMELTADRAALVCCNMGVLMMYRLSNFTLLGLFTHPSALHIGSFGLRAAADGLFELLTVSSAATQEPNKAREATRQLDRLEVWPFPQVFADRNQDPTVTLEHEDSSSVWPTRQQNSSGHYRRASTVRVSTKRGDRLLPTAVHPRLPIVAVASKFSGRVQLWRVQDGTTEALKGFEATQIDQASMKCAVLLPSAPGLPHTCHNSGSPSRVTKVGSDWPVLLLAGMSDGSCALVDLATQSTLLRFVANSDRRAVSCIAVGFLSVASVIQNARSPQAALVRAQCKRCGACFDLNDKNQDGCRIHPGD